MGYKSSPTSPEMRERVKMNAVSKCCLVLIKNPSGLGENPTSRPVLIHSVFPSKGVVGVIVFTSFSPSSSICYLERNKTTNARILKVNLLSFVYVCLFHWAVMEQRLFIISNIFVVKQVVVVFFIVEEYKGRLLLFCIFTGFFNSCFNSILFSKEQLLHLILFLIVTVVLGITCFCFNSHLIYAHEIIKFSVSAYLKIS